MVDEGRGKLARGRFLPGTHPHLPIDNVIGGGDILGEQIRAEIAFGGKARHEFDYRPRDAARKGLVYPDQY